MIRTAMIRTVVTRTVVTRTMWVDGSGRAHALPRLLPESPRVRAEGLDEFFEELALARERLARLEGRSGRPRTCTASAHARPTATWCPGQLRWRSCAADLAPLRCRSSRRPDRFDCKCREAPSSRQVSKSRFSLPFREAWTVFSV